MVEITVAHIKAMFDLAIQKLQKDGNTILAIDADEYWKVLPPERYVFDKEPELAVGSLSDDFLTLQTSIQQNEILTYTDFDRLAAILNAISEQLAPTINNQA